MDYLQLLENNFILSVHRPLSTDVKLLETSELYIFPIAILKWVKMGILPFLLLIIKVYFFSCAIVTSSKKSEKCYSSKSTNPRDQDLGCCHCEF